MSRSIMCSALLSTVLLAPATCLAATPQLENATISGNGGTLTIARMPIKTATGVIYRDVTIQLRADEDGNVSFARGRAPLASGAPGPVARGGTTTTQEAGLTEVQPLVQAPSKPPKVQQFKTGTYQSADGSLIHIIGGGNALLEGVPIWTLSTIGGTAGPLSSATWYEGIIADNPRHRMIRNAGIVSTDYAYGTSDAGDSKLFGSGALIGATQTGDTLTIVSFHHGCCSNGSEPVASLSFTFIGR